MMYGKLVRVMESRGKNLCLLISQNLNSDIFIRNEYKLGKRVNPPYRRITQARKQFYYV